MKYIVYSLLCCCVRMDLFKENVRSWSNRKVRQKKVSSDFNRKENDLLLIQVDTLTALPLPLRDGTTVPLWSLPEPSLRLIWKQHLTPSPQPPGPHPCL